VQLATWVLIVAGDDEAGLEGEVRAEPAGVKLVAEAELRGDDDGVAISSVVFGIKIGVDRGVEAEEEFALRPEAEA
jgi:hypothetical protein